jgi:hypothetical protein
MKSFILILALAAIAYGTREFFKIKNFFFIREVKYFQQFPNWHRPKVREMQ